MKKKLIVATVLALSSGVAAAQSGEKAGWYAGLDLGYSRLGTSGSDVTARSPARASPARPRSTRATRATA